MALIQGIISLIARTFGKILSALLDWAVVSLFGRVTGTRKVFLWGMMAAAAAWPILLVGVVAPKAALFVVAFVPLSSKVAPNVVRWIWIAAAVLVPIAVGVTVARQSPTGRREGHRPKHRARLPDHCGSRGSLRRLAGHGAGTAPRVDGARPSRHLRAAGYHE
jgi:hypothetical protein